MKPKGQGNNPLRIDQSDLRISRMKFSHWLERRDKHEGLQAINSQIYNASNAPSSNQRTFIHKIELRSFERALGEFFLDFVASFERTIQFISIVKRNYFDLVEILQY